MPCRIGTLNNGRQRERGAPWLPDNVKQGDNLGQGGNTCGMQHMHAMSAAAAAHMCIKV